MTEKQRLVVIGNGMAGARAVEEILARGGGQQFTITMFGAEPYGNYNRIMLSDVLNGNQSPEQIFLNPLPWYAEHNITLHAGTAVAGIDRAAREVVTQQGLRLPYDILILATGSHAFVPPIENLHDTAGRLKEGVFVFRTLADCQQIAAYAQRSQRAAVIGGGLLGLEAARGLLSHGCEVHVVQRASHLMNQQLDSSSGALLKAAMEALGVQVHCDTLTSSIIGDGHVTGLKFEDGTELACDLLVIAAGITPNVDLALGCGLRVERGIVVTDQMRSVEDSHIYAVGECAQHRGMVYGLVAPIWEQVRVLAEHLTRGKEDAAYQGSKLATKLKVIGVELASMGRVEAQDAQDEVVLYSEPRRGIYKKLVVRDDRLVGAILLGDTGKAAYLQQAFDRNTPLPEERAALLFDMGGPARQESIVEMPDDKQVCNCNGVSKGAIRQCVAQGKRSPKAVMEATRAGMGCGSCKSQVQELVSFLCAGEVEENAPINYYVPGVPLARPEEVALIGQRGLTSASTVLGALAGNKEGVAMQEEVPG
jgi:nitrite reductase (NADH) large subunit